MQIDWNLIGQIVWLGYLVGYCIIRWVPNRRSRRTSIAVTKRPPAELTAWAFSWTGLFIVPVIWVSTGWPEEANRPIGPISVLIGTLAAAGSLRLFRVTHKALGKMWSHSLDLREDHVLVTSGIYEKLRHPMYTAFWLWAVSQPFLLANWVAGLAGIVGFGGLFFLRIGQEEKMMESRFGDDYRRYRERTKRIIPGIY